MSANAVYYIAAAVIGYSAYETNQNQKAAARNQKQGIEGQKKMADLEVRKSRLDARRQVRAARAAALSSGEAAGIAPESSAITGSLGSVSSSAARNDNFLTGMGAWQGYVLDKQSAVVDATNKANTWSAVGALATTIFSASSGPKPKPTPATKK